MILFYFLFLTIVVLLVIGGYDSTMRLVMYIDLRIRELILDMRIWFFKRKLKKQLNQERKELKKQMEQNQ
jgi:hypothetical protein